MNQIVAPKQTNKERQVALVNLLIQKRAIQCISSFYEFLQEFWEYVSTEKLVLNWHIKSICEELQILGDKIIKRQEAEYDLIINIPPGLTKSTMVSVMFPVWLWLHRPDIVVINSSYAEGLSVDHSLKSKTVFKCERFQLYFSQYFVKRFGLNIFLVKDTEKDWRNNFGGARIATSTGGTITGKHGDLIIRDDPMNPEQSESEAARNQCHRFNDRTLSSRKKDKDKTPTITVMQRLHTDDTTGHDMAKIGKPMRLICFPAEENEFVTPPEYRKMYVDGLLDPVRLSRKTLQKALMDMGSYGYSGQFLMNPVIAGGNYIRNEWFKEFSIGKLEEDATSEKARLIWMYTMDGAYTEKEKNDPTAIMAYCLWRNCMYVRDIAVVRMEMPELIKFIPEFCRRNGYENFNSKVFIEPKANGISVAQMLKRETKLNVILDKPPTTDKVARTKECLPFLESGRAYLLKGANFVLAFLRETGEFPIGLHDDQVDVLTMAVRRCIEPERGLQQWRNPQAS